VSYHRHRRPWERHLSIAVLLVSVAFAVGELWNVFAGSAIAAAAFFVALRPLFLRGAEARRAQKSAPTRPIPPL
jgi:hypothetical protein